MPKTFKKKWVRKSRSKTASIGLLNQKVNKLVVQNKPEIKRFVIAPSVVPFIVGQIYYNGTGHYVFESTPNIPQGVQHNQRIGGQVTIQKAIFKFQFYQQISAITDIRLKICFFETSGTPEVIATTSQVAVIYNINGWLNAYNTVAVYDTTSLYNLDGKGVYKLVKTKNLIVRKDGTASQVNITNATVVLSKPYALQYSRDTANLRRGQTFVVIFCDNGNCHPTLSSTLLGVAQPAANSGLICNFSTEYRYTDE